MVTWNPTWFIYRKLKTPTLSCDLHSLKHTPFCLNPKKPQKPEHHHHGVDLHLLLPPAAIVMLAVASSSSTWLRARRSRCIFLLLCSPILIPFLFATFPLLCAAELFLCLCRRQSRGKLACDEAEADRLRRCEEGRCAAEEEEMGLLQRYLEDQLLLVGSVYDCGEYDEDLYQGIQGYDDSDSNTPLLS